MKPKYHTLEYFFKIHPVQPHDNSTQLFVSRKAFYRKNQAIRTWCTYDEINVKGILIQFVWLFLLIKILMKCVIENTFIKGFLNMKIVRFITYVVKLISCIAIERCWFFING